MTTGFGYCRQGFVVALLSRFANFCTARSDNRATTNGGIADSSRPVAQPQSGETAGAAGTESAPFIAAAESDAWLLFGDAISVAG